MTRSVGRPAIVRRVSRSQALSLAALLLLLVGCSSAERDGALWHYRESQLTLAIFGQSEQHRADEARAFELSLADAALAAEEARLAGLLATCPSSERRALALSPGAQTRDRIRVRIEAEPERSARVAQLA